MSKKFKSGDEESNPKNYLPFTQQPYCCVAASLQSVFYRRGLNVPIQEELAAQLGLIVPEEDASFLPLARTGKKPPSGWGTQIQDLNYDPNIVFKQLGKFHKVIAPNHKYSSSLLRKAAGKGIMFMSEIRSKIERNIRGKK